ncbi:MAG TPA: hypothetical protein ENK05_04635 [Gammaproteobacteria bacterium]|nr:hypothetical protein [Gammaproteobacteria bacterium]
MLKIMPGLALAVLLAGCQTAATRNPDSPFYMIPSGSKLVLNREIRIPEKQAHVKLQHGRIVGGVDEYTVNCRFTVKDLGPSTVKPDTFNITRAEAQLEWEMYPSIMRYYRKIYLRSDKQPDVLNLMCQRWDLPYGAVNVSVPDMREAVGEYFTFELLPPPAQGKP